MKKKIIEILLLYLSLIIIQLVVNKYTGNDVHYSNPYSLAHSISWKETFEAIPQVLIYAAIMTVIIELIVYYYWKNLK